MKPNYNPWNFLVTKKTTLCEFITKRELFAAMAMQGLLANERGWGGSENGIARYSIAHADALIAELSKGTES